jgi:hypothetical protein
MDFGLWYSRSKDFNLTTYTNVYWEGSIDDKKSTSGGEFFIGNCLVSWLGKRQTSISLSTTKVEYIAVTITCCTQFLWMKQTLKDIKVEYDHPISIICDNTSAINISKNHVMYSKTKNIPIKYHFLREQVIEQSVKLEYIPTKEQVADIFTKPLPRDTFEYIR